MPQSRLQSHRGGRRFSFAAALATLVLSGSAGAQEMVDTVAINRIKAEGLGDRSQIMETASWLTDVFGARLTGSPNIKEAADWTVKKLTEWGMVNAKLETWGEFGRGWTNERTSVHVIAPTPWPVIAVSAAWNPGTNGTVTGDVVKIEAESAADLEKYRGKLRNAFVMLAEPRALAPSFRPDASRWDQTALDSITVSGPPAPRAGGPGGRGGRGGGRGGRGGGAPGEVPFPQARSAFLAEQGIAAIIQSGGGNSTLGTVFTGGAGSRDPRNPTRTLTLLLAAEHYNRIARIVEKGVPVRMEANVKNTFHDADLNAWNVVADLPGTDPQLKDEVVMLGAHFDSWHAGTGATDNAAGSAVMLEALRILKASGLPMKRTVRLGLWTGEENGLLGSRAYVRNHYGSADSLKPEAAKFSGYFNLDNGTGKIRGVYLQGNEKVRPIFTEWMRPFNSMGTRAINGGNTGGTDHQAFDGVGLPGWQFIQDAVEYSTRTHHSNMDVFDRLVADDMKHNATVVAAFVWLAANRPDLLPRKTPVVTQ